MYIYIYIHIYISGLLFPVFERTTSFVCEWILSDANTRCKAQVSRSIENCAIYTHGSQGVASRTECDVITVVNTRSAKYRLPGAKCFNTVSGILYGAQYN